jgi:hypothetical protein
MDREKGLIEMEIKLLTAIAVSLSILPGLTLQGRPKKSTDGAMAGE